MSKPVFFFDWDGTIADSMDLCVAEIQAAIRQLRLPEVPLDVIRSCNGPTNTEALAILGVPEQLGEAFLQARADHELRLIPTTEKLFPGIAETLQALHQVADLAIVSNAMPAYVQACLQRFGLGELFVAVSTFRAGVTKAQALGQLLAELRPDHAVMVGDRLGDIQAGKANGLPTIAAAYGFGNAEEWAAADAVVFSPEELRQLLLAQARAAQGV